MKISDYKEFAKLMAVMQEIFTPDKPVSKEKVQIYFDLLREYPIERIKYGVHKIIETKKISTFPLPAEIKEAMGYSDDLNIELEAAEAWSKACDIAFMATRDSDDPILNETIRISFGGWERFGQSELRNETFDRAHFLRCYKNISSKMLMEKDMLKELDETRKKIKLLEKKKEK